MPKQNRPVVRDGRLQAPKKRTDRSYLSPGGGAPTAAPPAPTEEMSTVDDSTIVEPEAMDAVTEAIPTPAPAPVAPVVAPPRVAPAPAVTRTPTAAAGRLPATARALQQQGVRKRREVDLGALARRDTQYAIHELRRIAVLATLVIVTLIVLGIVLR